MGLREEFFFKEETRIFLNDANGKKNESGDVEQKRSLMKSDLRRQEGLGLMVLVFVVIDTH